MSTGERRVAGRIKTELRARWEGVLSRSAGVVTDLGINGCFILTTDDVKLRELIRLELELPEDGWIYLWGEVVYQVAEMGFALNFEGINAAEEELLARYIETVERNDAA